MRASALSIYCIFARAANSPARGFPHRKSRDHKKPQRYFPIYPRFYGQVVRATRTRLRRRFPRRKGQAATYVAALRSSRADAFGVNIYNKLCLMIAHDLRASLECDANKIASTISAPKRTGGDVRSSATFEPRGRVRRKYLQQALPHDCA